MIALKLLVALVLGGCVASDDGRRRFDGHKLLSVTPTTPSHLSVLYSLESTDGVLYWEGTWEPVVGREVLFNVAPYVYDDVISISDSAGTSHKLVSDNIQVQLDELWSSMDETRDFDLDGYNDYDVILEEMHQMAARCPDHLGVICDVVELAETYEGRIMTYLRIRQFDDPDKISLADDDTGKDGYWMDGNIHGGEWLTGSTTLYIMDHMTRDYETDDEVRRLVDDYDWYFMPILNADGYQYSRDSGDNSWRKNRRPNTDVGSDCNGTDLNRNYDFHWMEHGADQDPCSTHYAGISAGSELETQAISELSVRLGSKLRGWISAHAAAYWWMHPWGWIDENEECRAEDHDNITLVAEAMANASAAVHGNPWLYGTICELAWPLTGSSVDYVKGVGGVKYSFLPELAAHRPPTEMIVESYLEIWPAVVAMADTIVQIDGPPPKPELK